AFSLDAKDLPANELGLEINPDANIHTVENIAGFVGSDITAVAIAVDINLAEEMTLVVDIGTNGEIVLGTKNKLYAASCAAGPALEGASIECGMRAEEGAIESVFIDKGEICYKTIGNTPPKGICGSGIIDLVSVLLEKKIINRSGSFIENTYDRIITEKGVKRYLLDDPVRGQKNNIIFISELDIENVVVAKAAIFSAMKILLKRLDLDFQSIDMFYIAGAFGNYLNIDSAIAIGLIPDLPREKYRFVGNTSIKGAKLTAFYDEAFNKIVQLRQAITYYDLMGAQDYVEEFQKAIFLPHTDIELFHASS
ncbi:hypothetical protein LCGC14_2874450, partial [marine sediment metagenome]